MNCPELDYYYKSNFSEGALKTLSEKTGYPVDALEEFLARINIPEAAFPNCLEWKYDEMMKLIADGADIQGYRDIYEATDKGYNEISGNYYKFADGLINYDDKTNQVNIIQFSDPKNQFHYQGPELTETIDMDLLEQMGVCTKNENGNWEISKLKWDDLRNSLIGLSYDEVVDKLGCSGVLSSINLFKKPKSYDVSFIARDNETGELFNVLHLYFNAATGISYKL